MPATTTHRPATKTSFWIVTTDDLNGERSAAYCSEAARQRYLDCIARCTPRGWRIIAQGESTHAA